MKDAIWTEEENDFRQFNNMMNPRNGKKCANCHWGNAEKNEEFVTCGHHINNFSVNSFCAYWTEIDDLKVKAYFKRRYERAKKKFESINP